MPATSELELADTVARGCEQVAKGTQLDDEEGGEEGSAEGYVQEKGGATVWLASVVIFGCGLIGLGFAAFLFYTVSQISLDSTDETQSLAEAKASKDSDEELISIYETVRKGAQSFLWAEYQICFIFIAGFGLLILVLTSRVSDEEGNGVWKWNIGAITALSFVVGGLTSILSGYIGKHKGHAPYALLESRECTWRSPRRTCKHGTSRTSATKRGNHTHTSCLSPAHTASGAVRRAMHMLTLGTRTCTCRHDGRCVLERAYCYLRQEAGRGRLDGLFQLRLPCCEFPRCQTQHRVLHPVLCSSLALSRTRTTVLPHGSVTWAH
jgi:hypothetical protein